MDMSAIQSVAKIEEGVELPAWQKPGAILLISCYELGHQPHGITLPMGFLERAGYRPGGMDISVEPFDREKVLRARFVGISVPMHTALRLGAELAGQIRQLRPDCHICFYGLYASLNAGYLLEHGVDSVIGGEYEESMAALIGALEAGRNDENISGVSRRDHQKDPYLGRLSFPLPSRSDLPGFERYARLERDGHLHTVGYVEASRGCRHRCLHCPVVPVYNGRFFLIPHEMVLEDIRRQVAAGVRHITFGDPDFLNGPGHAMKIVRALHAEFPQLTFDVTTKVEHILKHRSLIPELAEYGCLFMISAIESLSDTVLENLEKGHTQADIFAAVSIVRRAGIAFRPSLVAFTPWTTLADYIRMLDFVESEGLIDHVDPVQYTIRLLVPPGSALLSHSAIKSFLEPPDRRDPATFTTRWSHPDPRMDQLCREVAALVEQAASVEEDPELTFYRVAALAHAAQGGSQSLPVLPAGRRERDRPPRLTEPWFCCAEPTENQYGLLQNGKDKV